jgi:hypothetical protein
MTDKAFGLACTVAWTELHNAMSADGMNPPEKCGSETRKWIKQVVRDSFTTQGLVQALRPLVDRPEREYGEYLAARRAIAKATATD